MNDFDRNIFMKGIDLENNSHEHLRRKLIGKYKHLTEIARKVIGFYDTGKNVEDIGYLLDMTPVRVRNILVRNIGILKTLI